jgi:hypothetical protein
MEQIKLILSKEISNESKVNELLKFDSEMHTNLGIDSTAQERLNVKQLSDIVINEVIKLDPDLNYLKNN